MAYNKKSSSEPKIDVYEIVTNKILEKLEQGQVPWQKPWDIKTGLPCNITTGKEYNGINVMLLGSQNYDSKYWLSYKQCAEKGGNVKKGEKGSMIVFWNFLDKNTGKAVSNDSDHPKLKSGDVFPILKYYTVFNVNQCENLDLKRLQEEIAAQNTVKPASDKTPIEAMQAIVDQYQDGPEIKFGFTKACYCPSTDEINMPKPEHFNSIEEHYSTLYHEMIHSTGHEDRLKRRDSIEYRQFGDEAYSKEELVAEMGSSFLSAKAGIEHKTIDNSTAYIQSWMKALKNDKKLLITAAGQAQKAANYITNDLEHTKIKNTTVSDPEPNNIYHIVRDSMDTKNSVHRVFDNKLDASKYIDIMNTNVNGVNTGQYNIGTALTTDELKNNLSTFNAHEVMREWSKKNGATIFPESTINHYIAAAHPTVAPTTGTADISTPIKPTVTSRRR